MELEELRRQIDWLEVQTIKKQGQKRDLEAECDLVNDKADEFTVKMEEIEKIIILKKRFIMECDKIEGKDPLAP
jgi:hypothetical protein